MLPLVLQKIVILRELQETVVVGGEVELFVIVKQLFVVMRRTAVQRCSTFCC
jgi:hypothetical protein